MIDLSQASDVHTTTASASSAAPAKDFPYADDGDLDVCPCCGSVIVAAVRYACSACWDLATKYAEDDADRARGRAAMHALGKRWRAEGKLPPVAIAPAARCTDCGASPCDCHEVIWGYWFKVNAGAQWCTCGSRANARDSFRLSQADRRIRACGPIQRQSEPNPFAASSTRVAVDLAALPPLPPVPGAAASTGRFDVVLRPSLDVLARALFETDATVLAAIASVEGPGALGRRELLAKAYARDESGRRTWAETTAKAVSERLGWVDTKGERK